MAAALAIAVTTAVLVFVANRDGGGSAGQAAPTSQPTGSGPATSARTSPSPTGSPAPTGRASTPAPTGSASGGGSAQAIPPGFVQYRDRTGFSVVVPAGWQQVRSGTLMDFRDPQGGRFLRIDQSDSPKGDPVTDWQRQAANFARTHAGYRLVRPIARVDYRGWAAADWEFTWNSGGATIHVLNRNVVPRPTKAYALYWSVPDSQWASSRRIFDIAARTFQPTT